MNYIRSYALNESFSLHGNPDGIPLLFLHGGPGYRCDESNLSYFDLNKFNVIFFNQRGSSSHAMPAMIKNNTTWDLIDDIENLRKSLNIDKWYIYGQSWGTTLGLVYAIKNPNSVLGLFLKGIFLGRKEDIDWLYSYDKLGNYSDKCRENFIKLLIDPIGIKMEDDVLLEWSKILLRDNYDVDLAVKWTLWEDINCGPDSADMKIPDIDDDYVNVSKAISRIEIHYFINNCFMPDNFILNNISNIKCPVIIFQGDEDRICPKYQAIELNDKLQSLGKKSKLYIVPDTGHTTSDIMLKYFHKYIK